MFYDYVAYCEAFRNTGREETEKVYQEFDYFLSARMLPRSTIYRNAFCVIQGFKLSLC